MEYLIDKSFFYGMIMFKNSANFQDGKNLCFCDRHAQRNQNESEKKGLIFNRCHKSCRFRTFTYPSTDWRSYIYRSNGNKQHFSLESTCWVHEVARMQAHYKNGYNWFARFASNVRKMHLCWLSIQKLFTQTWAHVAHLTSARIAFGNWFFRRCMILKMAFNNNNNNK